MVKNDEMVKIKGKKSSIGNRLKRILIGAM